MFLGIEIGGTKLQFGVGRADGSPFVDIKRADVCPADGAQGILRQIRDVAGPLIAKHGVQAVGFGFGGPVDVKAGRVVKSHHVTGWDAFPLVDWCCDTFGLPAAVANDADMAGLGEARFGAGSDCRVVFYSNVGSGIGGALVIGGRVYAGSTGIASEIGHVRVGPDASGPHQIVEIAASGWAIAEAARRDVSLAAQLQHRYNCTAEQLTCKMVAQAAADGDASAVAILHRAVQTYGWAIAQMITLLSPEVVVIGGGVPLIGEKLFFEPLRSDVDRYVFPPLRGTYRLAAASLGEEVVVHGSLALAKAQAEQGNPSGLFIP
jgi:glucokinase